MAYVSSFCRNSWTAVHRERQLIWGQKVSVMAQQKKLPVAAAVINKLSGCNNYYALQVNGHSRWYWIDVFPSKVKLSVACESQILERQHKGAANQTKNLRRCWSVLPFSPSQLFGWIAATIFPHLTESSRQSQALVSLLGGKKKRDGKKKSKPCRALDYSFFFQIISQFVNRRKKSCTLLHSHCAPSVQPGVGWMITSLFVFVCVILWTPALQVCGFMGAARWLVHSVICKHSQWGILPLQTPLSAFSLSPAFKCSFTGISTENKREQVYTILGVQNQWNMSPLQKPSWSCSSLKPSSSWAPAWLTAVSSIRTNGCNQANLAV